MRKFIYKVLFFTLSWLLIIWSILFFFPMKYGSISYPITANIKKYLQSEQNSKYVIIGDSRAMAGLAPNLMDSAHTYNLSMGGTTPIEGYFTLKKLIENNKTPEKIVLSYAPLHLTHHNIYPSPIQEDFYDLDDLNELYFDINESNETFWDTLKLKKSNYKSIDLIKAYAIRLKFPTYYNSLLLNSKLNRGEFNGLVAQKIDQNKGSYFYGERDSCNFLNKEAECLRFSPKSIFITSLKKTFDLAIEYKISVHYVTAPFNQASFSKLNEQYKLDYHLVFQKLESEYPKINFRHKIKPYANDCFGDRSHLNKKGQLLFSKEINDLIKEK